MTEGIDYIKLLDLLDCVAIYDAVGEAEQSTSGEIRVLVVQDPFLGILKRVLLYYYERTWGNFGSIFWGKKNPKKAADQRARLEFFLLGLNKTGGVLIQICAQTRSASVVADNGIHECVPDGTWEDPCRFIQEGFHHGLRESVVKAVRFIGQVVGKCSPITRVRVERVQSGVIFKK